MPRAVSTDIETSQLSTAPARSGNGGATLWAGAADLLTRAGRTSFWPLTDQAVASAGNFLTFVIVARALPSKGEYGLFGLVLECIFYVNTLTGALIGYPLTVRGATADEGQLRRLAGAALLLTCLLTLPVALAGAGIAALNQRLALGLAAAAALVAWQAQEAVRRGLLANFRYAQAIPGDALRYLGTAAGAFAVWRTGSLTLTNVFLLIAAFSALALLVQAVQLRPRAVAASDLLLLAREFWAAGRWLLLTSLSALLISICGVWTLSFAHGNDVVGDFYAVANFTKPVNPILVTICGLVMQYAARSNHRDGIASARRVTVRFGALALALIGPYLLALILVPGLAIRLLYGAQSHFRDPSALMALRLVGVGFALFLLLSLISSFLNGVGRTRDTFVAQLVNSVATVGITLPMTIWLGLIGMMLGGLIAGLIQLVAMIYLFRRAT